MPRAILSLSDKSGVDDLARTLTDLGWDLVASGGTAAHLREIGIPVTPVEIVTGAPELLGGRVKTLHPAIHAGILARDTDDDLAALTSQGYAPIDMVVCNLYPFEETIHRPGVTLEEAIEHIDIGGVTLIRAAAKNHARVTVLCDPLDYPRIIALLRATGQIELAVRREMALKAFAHTRDYDTAIHAYLLDTLAPAAKAAQNELPGSLSLGLVQTESLRYGENPHQAAAFYAPRKGSAPLAAELLGGKALSYNNLLDLDAAWEAVEAFDQPAVVIVKHQTPTGIAVAASIAAAFPNALASDRVSAFGGVLAVNQPVDEQFVTELSDLFVEAIAAPEFTDGAREMLTKSRKNCRLVRMLPDPFARTWQMRTIRGGFLAQSIDRGDPPEAAWRTVTRWKPTAEEMETLHFAWKCVQFIPSNAILLATPGTTIGVGGGLPSRVDATRLAIEKAGQRARGAVLASDAFFPFADAIQLAVQAGVTAIVQPGGSIRDAEVIAAADEAGIAMVFTGARHFRH